MQVLHACGVDVVSTKRAVAVIYLQISTYLYIQLHDWHSAGLYKVMVHKDNGILSDNPLN